jgi:glutathione S-transferase
LGRVPVLEDNGIIISESGAIIQYILSKYGNNKLVPDRDSDEFPYYLQWFHYSEGMIMPQMNIIVVETILLPPEKRNEVNLARAMKLLSRMLDVIEKNMENKKYLTNEFTAADMMTGHAVIMSRELGVDFSEKQNLLLYVDRLLSRPALQKAWNL